MSKKRLSVLGLALGTLVLGLLVGLMTVGTVAADPSPGVRFQLPRVDIGYAPEYGTGDWSTWIQVQNVSPPDPVTGLEPATGAIFFGWRAPSDPPLCPPNDAGPFVAYCQLIQGNAIWTLRSQLDEDIKSGIVYSVPEASFQAACNATTAALNGGTDAWLDWEAAWTAPPGEELAITVNRYGENDHGSFVSSTYTGISEDMDGEGYPYEYFAPYVMKGYNGLDTELTIQNSGTACTSIWIDFLEQGSCTIQYKQHIEQLAPGEAIRLRVPKEVYSQFDPTGNPNGCYFLGSAHITAEQPLGVIVDETSSTSNVDAPCLGPDPGTLLTHRARARLESRDGEPIEDTKVYADLIFREWSGWSSSIQVQNLSQTGQYTFVTVDFMDNGGDEILFLADWVCPGGGATFYLPAVANLGFDYVGAAEIESHTQINYPGQETPAQPIFVVVDLKKGDNPLTPGFDPQGGSYNAHPYSQKVWVDEVALPFISKDARAPGDPYTPWTSMIAIRNNSNCNKIKPTIWFKDETGRLLCEINSFWLHPKQLKLIDLENIGCLHAGYIGAAKVLIQPEDVEQLCDLDNDGHVDNLPTMPSVIVVEKGIIGYPFGVEDGDVTKIYEGVPYSTGDKHCDVDLLGTVIDSRTKEPLAGATITVPNGWADYHELAGRWVYTYTDAIGTTGYGGMFEIEEIVTFGTLEPAGTCYTVTVSLDGFDSRIIPDVCLSCGEDQVLNVQLDSTCDYVTVSGTVEDKETGLAIAGAEVEVTNSKGAITTTTSITGAYSISTVLFDADNVNIVSVTATGYNPSADSVYIPECGGAAQISFQLHQSPMSRILLYYGNGGVEKDISPLRPTVPLTTHNYYAAQYVIEYLGYQVDYTNVWPGDPDLEEYKVIFLLGPGNEHAGTLADPYDPDSDMFTPGQVAQLDLFLRNGGRLVVMADITDTNGAATSTAPISVENTLVNALNDLDVEFTDANNDGWSDGQVENAIADDLNGPDQLLGDTVPTTPITDVHTLNFDTAISITVDAVTATPGYIAAMGAAHPDAEDVICAADTMPGVTRLNKAGFAGDVVLIGDLDWMDDASWMGTITYDVAGEINYIWPNWPADNENLLLNIVTF